MKLVYDETGKEVQVGDVAKTFRDEVVTVTGVEEPRHSGSTGRVYVKFDGADRSREFFPSVIGAKWTVDA